MNKPYRRHAIAAVSIVIAALSGAQAAAEEQFPARPLQMIVPFAAGGPTDIVVFLLGGKMSELLGQTVVV